jgi:hypothetical protein
VVGLGADVAAGLVVAVGLGTGVAAGLVVAVGAAAVAFGGTAVAPALVACVPVPAVCVLVAIGATVAAAGCVGRAVGCRMVDASVGSAVGRAVGSAVGRSVGVGASTVAVGLGSDVGALTTDWAVAGWLVGCVLTIGSSPRRKKVCSPTSKYIATMIASMAIIIV